MTARIVGYLRRHHVALLALFIALGGTSFAATTIPDRGGVIHACYKKSGAAKGALRVISGTRCGRREAALKWNQRGRDGRPGAPGPGVRWALVRQDGTILAQSGGISATQPITGLYDVDFGSSVVGHGVFVSRHSSFTGGPGEVAATPCGGAYPTESGHPDALLCGYGGNSPNKVEVATYGSASGSRESGDFYVMVLP